MRKASLLSLALSLMATACLDKSGPDAVTGAEVHRQASFALTGRILGPDDDESDIELTLEESNGVGTTLNFIRLTCSNRASQEWGADGFLAELGTNRIAGDSTLVVRRHYRCPSSGRPQTLTADLTGDDGVHYRVDGAPYFPGWPGT